MISRFHYLTQDLSSFNHTELAERACSAGARLVQVRTKLKSLVEWSLIAETVAMVCKKYGATLIVNDSIEVALRVGAHGVHLGKEDASPKLARKILGSKAIIGGTANNFDDVKKLSEEGVDYIGLGPYKPTLTKEPAKLAPVLGKDGVRRIVEKATLAGIYTPIILIGGINADDVSSVMPLGVYGVAASSAVHADGKIESQVKKFLASIQPMDLPYESAANC